MNDLEQTQPGIPDNSIPQPEPQNQTQPTEQTQPQAQPQTQPVTPYPHNQGQPQTQSQDGILGDYKSGILDTPSNKYAHANAPSESAWRIQDGKAYFDQAPQKIRNEDGSIDLDKLYSWTKGAEDYINNHHRPYEVQTFGNQMKHYMPNATDQDVEGFTQYFNEHKIPPHAVGPVMEMLGTAMSEMEQFYEYASPYMPNEQRTQQGVEWLRSQYGSDYDTVTLTVRNALANESPELFNAVTHNPALIDFLYRSIKDVAPITDPQSESIPANPSGREALEAEIDKLDEMLESGEGDQDAIIAKQNELYEQLGKLYSNGEGMDILSSSRQFVG